MPRSKALATCLLAVLCSLVLVAPLAGCSGAKKKSPLTIAERIKNEPIGILFDTANAVARGDDPLLGSFLDYLARDIAAHPQRLRAMDGALAKRMLSATRGIKVDLEAALDPADE